MHPTMMYNFITLELDSFFVLHISLICDLTVSLELRILEAALFILNNCLFFSVNNVNTASWCYDSYSETSKTISVHLNIYCTCFTLSSMWILHRKCVVFSTKSVFFGNKAAALTGWAPELALCERQCYFLFYFFPWVSSFLVLRCGMRWMYECWMNVCCVDKICMAFISKNNGPQEEEVGQERENNKKRKPE